VLDEQRRLAARIAQRIHVHLHVLLAARRVVHVQYSLVVAGLRGLSARARFAGLVAGHGIAVRHLVAVAAEHLASGGERFPVGLVGRDDAVVGVDHDVRAVQLADQ
jgi:hypothetical protein